MVLAAAAAAAAEASDCRRWCQLLSPAAAKLNMRWRWCWKWSWRELANCFWRLFSAAAHLFSGAADQEVVSDPEAAANQGVELEPRRQHRRLPQPRRPQVPHSTGSWASPPPMASPRGHAYLGESAGFAVLAILSPSFRLRTLRTVPTGCPCCRRRSYTGPSGTTRSVCAKTASNSRTTFHRDSA